MNSEKSVDFASARSAANSVFTSGCLMNKDQSVDFASAGSAGNSELTSGLLDEQ